MTHQGPFVLAIDQGTSGTSAAIYTIDGQVISSADVGVRSHYPQPGWVEQDPYEILASIRQAFQAAVDATDLKPGQIVCMGVAHQGESLLLWDRLTGQPVHNVISWQCVRSADVCDRLIEQGAGADFRQRAGLALVPEWPATKVPWALQHIAGVRGLAQAGRLAYSQIDAWLMQQLTRERSFCTDHSMASRSGLYSLRKLNWDDDLVALFQAEDLLLPEVVASDGYFGEVDFGGGWRIPWRANLIDQASALLGQACISAGEVKITYGTCAALWCNLGGSIARSHYMDTSVAWYVDGQPTYALVGETTTAGAAITWLRETFRLTWDSSELAAVAQSAGEHAGLIFVPAFSGLGPPHGAPHVRGTLYGLTAGVGPEHLLRAGLDAIAYGVRDMLEALANEAGAPWSGEIKADGGMAANAYLMQVQADILGRPVLVPSQLEGTSAGIAFLAGLASGYQAGLAAIKPHWRAAQRFEPRLAPHERARRYADWKAAINHTLAAYAPGAERGQDTHVDNT